MRISFAEKKPQKRVLLFPPLQNLLTTILPPSYPLVLQPPLQRRTTCSGTSSKKQ